jgi:hypothetical protein
MESIAMSTTNERRKFIGAEGSQGLRNGMVYQVSWHSASAFRAGEIVITKPVYGLYSSKEAFERNWAVPESHALAEIEAAFKASPHARALPITVYIDPKDLSCSLLDSKGERVMLFGKDVRNDFEIIHALKPFGEPVPSRKDRCLHLMFRIGKYLRELWHAFRFLVGFLTGLILALGVVYAIFWVALWAFVSLLIGLGVQGIHRPFAWWLPLAFACVIVVLRRVFGGSK